MTLKKRDGTFSAARITLLCTIIGTIAVLPMAIDCCKKFVAPWTVMPEKIDAIKTDIEEIKYKLQITGYAQKTNNPTMAKK